MAMLQTYHLSDWASPTIGAYLRLFWLGVDKFWLQFLPSLLGGLWFIYYWFKHYKTWNWMDELPVLLLVSQLISPYSWTYDLVILIPMLITATIRIITDWKRWSTLLLGVIFIAVNIFDLVLHVKMNEFWFIWMVPALFIWYLIVHWQYPKLPDRLFLSVPTIN